MKNRKIIGPLIAVCVCIVITFLYSLFRFSQVIIPDGWGGPISLWDFLIYPANTFVIPFGISATLANSGDKLKTGLYGVILAVIFGHLTYLLTIYAMALF